MLGNLCASSWSPIDATICDLYYHTWALGGLGRTRKKRKLISYKNELGVYKRFYMVFYGAPTFPNLCCILYFLIPLSRVHGFDFD